MVNNTSSNSFKKLKEKRIAKI